MSINTELPVSGVIINDINLPIYGTGGGSCSGLIDGTITNVDQEVLGGVESIRANAFDGLDIDTVSVPNNVVIIGDNAFANNSITSLSLGNGVETIGNNAFQNNSISEVELPESVTYIGDNAFANNSITNIIIPANVTTIGDGAFYGNELTEITMESDAPPSVTSTTFPDTLEKTNVTYNGYNNYVSDPNWSTYKDTIVRGLAIPSSITVTVNDYNGELVSGASVTITGNEQTYTGTTNESGVFTQGDLQPATYTISVAVLDGYNTPESQDVVVEENTQNSVTITYLEKQAGFAGASVSEINAIANDIATKGMTGSQVEATYGWKLGDTRDITLTTGETIQMRIIGFNHDTLSNGLGTAGVTLEMVNCLATRYAMNDTATTVGGYASCLMKTTTLPSIKTTLPQEWQNAIVNVDKKSSDGGGTAYPGINTSSEQLFLLSHIELFGFGGYAAGGNNEGTQYEYWKSKSATDRIKYRDTDGDGVLNSTQFYYIRSCHEQHSFVYMIVNNGNSSYASANDLGGISFAFCIGVPQPTTYGVRIDTTNSDPETAVAYTDDAVGFNKSYMDFTNSKFEYGSWADKFPFNQIKPCILKDGVVTTYLNPNNYAEDVDGNAVDITSTCDGDVMIEIPKVYYRLHKDDTYQYIQISDLPQEGFCCLAHTYKGVEKDKIYVGAYHARYVGSSLKSVSGQKPTTNYTSGTWRGYAQGKGTGYELLNFNIWTLIQCLYVIQFKNLNSQQALGAGRTNTSSTVYNGLLDANGMYYGSAGSVKFMGIEHVYGNVRFLVDGILVYGKAACSNIMVADVTSPSMTFNDSGNGYITVKTLTKTMSGYLSQIIGDNISGFIPEAVSGTETTYYSDYDYIYKDSSIRSVACGAGYNEGTGGGMFCLNADITPSSTNARTGAIIVYCG